MPKMKLLVLPLLALVILSVSFWYSDGWLKLCAGLALFLFGMQCLEEGLRRFLPDRKESAVLIPDPQTGPRATVVQELQHLGLLR